MDVKFMNQPKEISLGSIIKNKLEEKFDEVWIVSGIAKDSGIDVVISELEMAIKNGTKINIMLGVDRKNTSKDMLMKLLLIGCNLSIYINTDDGKVESRFIAFESKTDNSYVYISGGKFSEGGLLENDCLITEIKYERNEHESFKMFKGKALDCVSKFKSVEKDDITLLAMNGEILTRIIDRKIPSIKELYGSKEEAIGEQIYDEGHGLGIVKFDELENIDIEFDSEITLKNNVELQIEKETKKENHMDTVKTKEDLERLLSDKVEANVEPKKSRIIKDYTEEEFKKMNVLLIEAGKIIDELKLQKNLVELIKNFICEGNVNVHIIDNKNNREYDDEAEVTSNDRGIFIKTQLFKELEIKEKDLLRIIKQDSKEYKIEIIRCETKEFEIWERYLLSTIKGTKRKFGIE